MAAVLWLLCYGCCATAAVLCCATAAVLWLLCYGCCAVGAVTMVACLQGRILVLETKPQQNKLHVVCEKETRGAVYTITGFQVHSTCAIFICLFSNCAALLSCQQANYLAAVGSARCWCTHCIALPLSSTVKSR